MHLISIQVASSLTDSFLKVLLRFITRRGQPKSFLATTEPVLRKAELDSTSYLRGGSGYDFTDVVVERNAVTVKPSKVQSLRWHTRTFFRFNASNYL